MSMGLGDQTRGRGQVYMLSLKSISYVLRLCYLDLPWPSLLMLCWECGALSRLCWCLQNLWLSQGKLPVPMQLPQCHHKLWAATAPAEHFYIS